MKIYVLKFSVLAMRSWVDVLMVITTTPEWTFLYRVRTLNQREIANERQCLADYFYKQ